VLRLRQVIRKFQSTPKLVAQLRHANVTLALEALDELKERTILQLAEGGLAHADLSQVNLHRATFAKAHMQGVLFHAATLTETYFFEADLQEAVLTHANLTGANLRAVCLHKANLSQAVCLNANFARATLTECMMQGADLRGANFWRADLRGADFTSAQLAGANFSGAVCDEHTRLPNGKAWSGAEDWLFYTS
jgi:uncharacterized protein YjbI with pentapeptide repeats